MISHERKCIFVHQKKAAGTSVKRVFPDFVPNSPQSSYLSDGVLDPNWSSAPEVNEYMKFTVVRNPWDRFISGWLYCSRTKNRPLIDVLRHPPQKMICLRNFLTDGQSWLSRKSNLTEYVSRYGRNIRLLLRGVPKDFRDWHGHDYNHLVRQQHETILHPDGSLAVDRVLFYEELGDGLCDLEKALGAPLGKLPRANANDVRGDYRDYFDAESRELFYEIFSKDIEMFGYDFEIGRRVVGSGLIANR